MVKTLQQLLNTLPQQGELMWIGLRPAHRAPRVNVKEIVVTPEQGIEGDRYRGRSGQRQARCCKLSIYP